MTPASSAAENFPAVVVAAGSPSEQSHRPSAPSSYAVWEKERLKGKEFVMEVEKARCECCGFTEECTPAYIAAVRADHMGRWVCGLCAEAVGDEVRERRITTAEALDRQVAFARATRAPRANAAAAAGRRQQQGGAKGAEDDLVAAVARLLRRCLDSPPASPAAAAPHARKVAAAGSGGPDGADDA